MTLSLDQLNEFRRLDEELNFILRFLESDYRFYGIEMLKNEHTRLDDHGREEYAGGGYNKSYKFDEFPRHLQWKLRKAFKEAMKSVLDKELEELLSEIKKSVPDYQPE